MRPLRPRRPMGAAARPSRPPALRAAPGANLRGGRRYYKTNRPRNCSINRRTRPARSRKRDTTNVPLGRRALARVICYIKNLSEAGARFRLSICSKATHRVVRDGRSLRPAATGRPSAILAVALLKRAARRRASGVILRAARDDRPAPAAQAKMDR